MDLTMRQLVGLAKVMNIRITTSMHTEFAFHASLHKAEIPPLSEILGVDSNEGPQFDQKTDAALERRALEVLKERQKHVR